MVAIFDLAVWAALCITMIVSLSMSGGSSFMPGKSLKYVMIMCFFGASFAAAGAVVVTRTYYSKVFVGMRYVYLKIVSICFIQLSNIIRIAAEPSVMPTSSKTTGVDSVLIILWAALDIYFVFALRSYAAEIEPPSVEVQEFNMVNVQVAPPPVQYYYPRGTAAQYQPSYGPPPNVYPMGIPVQANVYNYRAGNVPTPQRVTPVRKGED